MTTKDADLKAKCALCKRSRGNHSAGTLHCPLGRGRHPQFSQTNTFLSKEEAYNNDLQGWMKVIEKSGENMRERSAQNRKDNEIRAAALSDIPLELVFDAKFSYVEAVAESLRAMIEEGPKNGFSECPDQLTVAMARAAYHWYKKFRALAELNNRTSDIMMDAYNELASCGSSVKDLRSKLDQAIVQLDKASKED